MKTLQDLILKTEKVDWRKIKPFQPEGLKKIDKKRTQKLKRSLINNGFLMAFYAFQMDGEIYFADGHIRYILLREMEDEGIDIPKFLTCSLLDIKNKSQAKKVVMAFNSHYADIDKDELLDWSEGLDLEELKDEFELDFSFDEPKEKKKKVITCPNCGEEF